ncbi:3-methyladenine DNA glycosylase [Mycobacterium sp. 1274761.0]|uniref:3-methyladenine DNA glycosylase n=1 Tax=Mycobacterium sp. 1274761.0 TaxID=1834077 RepID=UPI0007FDDE64|nr:3-methyladenine DNA glycosylase [Mycobacterium sp. 1274761.0]OBK78734.1 3-methyladenine DNA glycosylase [Mycobacterium sp. 1274761.0]
MLDPEEWLPRRDHHRRRVRALLDPYLRLRKAGQPHPVIDFLFTYYTLTPGQLRRWHPGYGVTLAGQESEEYANLRGYRRTPSGVAVDPAHLEKRWGTVEYIIHLLEQTANRPPNFGCFGLHEWAMVYRARPGELRHGLPLRLGDGGTDAVVESLPLRCTHFDAFRFFTDPAVRRNTRMLSRETQMANEQPGCLHAGMDLYKFAGKLLPLVGSDLLWDAFELAFQARELDMRASPYDLSAFGYTPVPVETGEGRAAYVRQQTGLARRAAAVRAKLLTRCQELQRARSK